jgi:hypothetical protein
LRRAFLQLRIGGPVAQQGDAVGDAVEDGFDGHVGMQDARCRVDEGGR